MKRTRPFGYVVLTSLMTIVLIVPAAIVRYVRESVQQLSRGHRQSVSR